MTEDRTGALIFVSLAEHYAEIVADRGIARKVSQSVWDAAIASLIGRIREGKLGEGLILAVNEVGNTLAAHFPPRPRDRDEVLNEVVLL
jgi:putative membrane protein